MNKEEKYLENWSNTLELAIYFEERCAALKEIINQAKEYIIENDNIDDLQLLNILNGCFHE